MRFMAVLSSFKSALLPIAFSCHKMQNPFQYQPVAAALHEARIKVSAAFCMIFTISLLTVVRFPDPEPLALAGKQCSRAFPVTAILNALIWSLGALVRQISLQVMSVEHKDTV